jgi:transposase-like protein
MPRRSFSTEQIINKLREAEVLVSQGKTVEEICRAIEISNQTYYRWRKEYGGLRSDQAQRLREMSRRTPGSKNWLPTFH